MSEWFDLDGVGEESAKRVMEDSSEEVECERVVYYTRGVEYSALVFDVGGIDWYEVQLGMLLELGSSLDDRWLVWFMCNGLVGEYDLDVDEFEQVVSLFVLETEKFVVTLYHTPVSTGFGMELVGSGLSHEVLDSHLCSALKCSEGELVYLPSQFVDDERVVGVVVLRKEI